MSLPPTWGESVRAETVGLPPKLARFIGKKAMQAAGHNDNMRSCYEGRCPHPADVARAIVATLRRAPELAPEGWA